MPIDAPLTLATLGRVFLRRGAEDGELLLEPCKPLALLVYLACVPGRSASRDELVDLLWGESSPERARGTLRQTLFLLRTLVGEHVLVTEGSLVRLASALDTDRDRFLAAVEAGQVDAAVVRYTGPFLPDFGVPGGRVFEEWAGRERARLHDVFRRSAEAVTRGLLDAGRAKDALTLSRRLRDEDREWQGAWRLLIETLVAAGEQLGARIECDAFERMLRENDAPVESKSQVILRLGRQETESGSSRVAAAVTELVGRETEFASLMQEWEHVRRGGAATVVLVAPSGNGKTRLLEEFASRLRSLRATPVAIRAHPGESSIPFALAADLAEALGQLPGASGITPASAGALVDLAPALSASFAKGVRVPNVEDVSRNRSRAVLEVASSVAQEKPQAILVDDWHWCDAASRQLLASLAMRLPPRVLLVVTSRPDHAIPFQPTRRLDLSALAEQHVRALLASLGASPAERWTTEVAQALTEASAGSPMLVVDAVSHAMESGALARNGDLLECPDPAGTIAQIRAGDALYQRISGISTVEREALDLLALAGQPMSVDALAGCLGVVPDSLRPPLAGLAVRQLAQEANGLWSCAHDSVRERLRDTMPVPGQRLRHRRIGEALVTRAVSEREMATALSHVMAGGELSAAKALLIAWIRRRRRGGDGRPPRQLLHALVDGNASADDVERLLRLLPWHLRAGRRMRVATGVAAAALLALAAALPIRSLLLPRTVMEFTSTPLALQQNAKTRAFSFSPTAVLALRDRNGELVDQPDTIDVRIVSGTGRLSGRTTEPMIGGRASFVGLELVDLSAATLEFTSRRSRAALRFPFRNMRDVARDLLAIEGGELARQRISASSPEITVRPREAITGHMSFRYTAANPNATYWFAGTPTWGIPSENMISFGSISTPASDREKSELISLEAPAAAGDYYLIFVFSAEPSADYVLSLTNWTVRAPRWDDSLDVATLPRDSIEKGMREGSLDLMTYKVYDGQLRYASGGVAFAAVRVRVREPGDDH